MLCHLIQITLDLFFFCLFNHSDVVAVFQIYYLNMGIFSTRGCPEEALNGSCARNHPAKKCMLLSPRVTSLEPEYNFRIEHNIIEGQVIKHVN